MTRIPLPARDTVPEDQLDAFDEMVQAYNGIPSHGPFSVMLHVPELMKRGEHFRAYVRGDESSLSLRIRELAMILTAREMDCLFIWHAHVTHARKAGVRDDIVDNIRDKVELTNLAPDEAAVVNYGREFFRTRRVSQATFEAAKAAFGVRGLIELTNLMGYYSSLAFNLNAFEVGLPDDAAEPPLPV